MIVTQTTWTTICLSKSSKSETVNQNDEDSWWAHRQNSARETLKCQTCVLSMHVSMNFNVTNMTTNQEDWSGFLINIWVLICVSIKSDQWLCYPVAYITHWNKGISSVHIYMVEYSFIWRNKIQITYSDSNHVENSNGDIPVAIELRGVSV